MPAITIDRLSKAYRIGSEAASYDTFREALMRAATAPLRRFRALAGRRDEADTLWALRDVSLTVQPGEVVGIIGRNGAGKSTLLKILSRITEPTSGEAELAGRVASLLEVGTGFHPELSGRENIYLNGAILGMRKTEIDAKFDEIVEFADVARFLDTPVKRYSSGMFVRLAFAVAAHLEPEILIVDEVLAVGDVHFQRKCLGKMQSVATGEGRTVLFVSHNMNAVVRLCSRAILLNSGQVVMDGPADEVVRAYAADAALSQTVELAEHTGRITSGPATFRRLRLCGGDDAPRTAFGPGETVVLKFELDVAKRIEQPYLGIGIDTPRGDRVCSIASYLGPDPLAAIGGKTLVTARFELPPLVAGPYRLDVGLADGEGPFVDAVEGAAVIEVSETDYLRSAHRRFAQMGHLMVRSQWSASPLEEDVAVGGR